MIDSLPIKIPELFDYSPRDLGFHSAPASKQENLDGTTIGLLALYELLNAADWAQTQQISRQPEKYHEEPFPVGTSNVIGSHPSSGDVNRLMLTSAVLMPLAVKMVPNSLKKALATMGIAAKANTVYNNQKIGLDAIRF